MVMRSDLYVRMHELGAQLNRVDEEIKVGFGHHLILPGVAQNQ